MQVGVIGLGKMGMNLSLNMIDHEIEVYGYDKFITTDVKKQNHTIIIKDNLKDLIETLKQPRILWLMVPSGTITKSVIEDLIPLLDEGDIVIDGGNSRYTDTLIHYELLQKNNIHLLDCGTSGGVVGARHGASFMIGGDKEIFDVVESLFSALAVQDGYA
ncbi:MAG: 6-phosphogluconate dehydrogenase (decarboxylating), partial [Candidatus Izimaplasma sp.]|nr:6-phosphogluconate dehydrogenase (decarboxylating) [Candidatus Izimaplasma bacterium]